MASTQLSTASYCSIRGVYGDYDSSWYCTVYGAVPTLVWDLRSMILICYAIQYLVFALHAARTRSDKYFDLTGAVTFCIAVSTSFAMQPRNLLALNPINSLFKSEIRDINVRAVLVTLCVLAWCLRLGSYLYDRICKDGVDRRMGPYKKHILLWFGTWNFQGAWCLIVGLPAYVVNLAPGRAPPLGMWDGVGLAVWAVGWAVEVVADIQVPA